MKTMILSGNTNRFGKWSCSKERNAAADDAVRFTGKERGGRWERMIFPWRFHFLESPSSHVPAAERKHTVTSLSQPFSLIVVDDFFCKSDDNAERWPGSLNYMHQSKFVRFARRLIILIVRPRRSIHFVFYGDVHCFTSHVHRRLATKSVCARDTLCGIGTFRKVKWHFFFFFDNV